MSATASFSQTPRSLAWDLADQLRLEEGLATIREAVEVARSDGSRSATGVLLGTLSEFEVAGGVGDPVAHAREAVALVFDAPNVYFRISALMGLGERLDTLGLDGAGAAYEQCLALAEEHGADWEAATSAIHLGWIAAQRSNLDEAKARFLQARAIAGRTADKSVDMFFFDAQAAHSLAELLQMRGDLDGARTAFLAN
jgi:tetratricopeptide (TPR) repeat protein